VKVKFSILFYAVVVCGSASDLRLGIIGTDTSHATAFATTLNDPAAKEHVEGARVVVAYKGGSPDVEASSSRVEKFATQLRDKLGVKFVDHIADMCNAVDGILLESVDGRTHLAQFKEAAQCGKPVFIDKPLASSLADAREIARIATEAHVPWFSASDVRFIGIESVKKEPIAGAIVWGPGPTEEHQQLDLSWYAIHAAEMLYALMGPGCAEVTRTTSLDADVVTCRWKDGRLGTMRVDRPYGKIGGVVFRPKNRADVLPDFKDSYTPLVREIVQFMTTHKPPVPNAETVEVIAFLDAAQRSKESGGKPATM
jgi:hypothetical protein